MNSLQTNIFQPTAVTKGQSLEIIDIFDTAGQKTISLHPHSSLTYLVVALHTDIHVQIVTTGPNCSCKVFGLFASDTSHPVTGSFKVSLKHSHTSADVELISFLHDGAKVAIDGSVDIVDHLDEVHACLLERNIVLGNHVSVTTLPRLQVASHNVHASHGATIDALDQQKLFYMMSRGLTQQQSQALLVNGYIEYVLGHFKDIGDAKKNSISKIVT